jgi:hypothetical protein
LSRRHLNSRANWKTSPLNGAWVKRHPAAPRNPFPAANHPASSSASTAGRF